MKIELKEISIKEVTEDYLNDDEMDEEINVDLDNKEDKKEEKEEEVSEKRESQEGFDFGLPNPDEYKKRLEKAIG